MTEKKMYRPGELIGNHMKTLQAENEKFEGLIRRALRTCERGTRLTKQWHEDARAALVRVAR